MVNNYDRFLLEQFTNKIHLIFEGYLNSSGEFILKMKQVSKLGRGKSSEISNFIINIIDDEFYISDKDLKQNYFDVTDKDDMVSFLFNNKLNRSADHSYDNQSLPYEMKGRGEIKIGRAVKYLLGLYSNSIGASDKDIEDFVNLYKSIKVDTDHKFKIVKDSDIKKCYNPKNYASERGSLGNSCMNGEPKSIFKIYTDNPKKVKILIYEDHDGLILGRALLWKLTDAPCDAKYFMDRVYTSRDSDELRFKQYAEENGFLYKKYMNSQIAKNIAFIYKGKDVFGEITVKLDGDANSYPFLDTLCFLDEGKDKLSNVPSEDCVILQDLGGDYEPCSYCGGTVKINEDELCHCCSEGHSELAKLKIKTKYNWDNIRNCFID